MRLHLDVAREAPDLFRCNTSALFGVNRDFQVQALRVFAWQTEQAEMALRASGKRGLSAELVYIRDFEIEAIVPGFIASVIAYSVGSSFYGFTPIFGDGLGLKFEHPAQLGWCALLGILAGLIARDGAAAPPAIVAG